MEAKQLLLQAIAEYISRVISSIRSIENWNAFSLSFFIPVLVLANGLSASNHLTQANTSPLKSGVGFVNEINQENRAFDTHPSRGRSSLL
jgi:hypothetical protein